MKKCPVCNRNYTDPTLNFCLEDGATLIAETGGFSQPPQNFAPLQQLARQPKKSHPVLWIAGILGGIVVLGIVGIIGLIGLLAASSGNNNNKRLVNLNRNSNNGIFVSNSQSDDSKNGNSSSAKDGENIDFTRWGERKTEMGETKLVGDEFQVSATKVGYYYVVIASSKFDDKYLTNDAIAKVTTHSVTGASPTLGYGLIVNSDVEPLKSDYAFLIRSDNQTFRVVRHQDRKEDTIVKWTPAAQIRTGTQTNQLEVRSVGKKLTFYINGLLATSVSDGSGADQGIVGLYASDAVPIGFSDLQITEN